MAGRPLDEVEYFTVAEIRKHRRLRDAASLLDDRLAAVSGTQERTDVERDYVAAMIAMHAQQLVVSTLLDILGFIPKVPATDRD